MATKTMSGRIANNVSKVIGVVFDATADVLSGSTVREAAEHHGERLQSTRENAVQKTNTQAFAEKLNYVLAHNNDGQARAEGLEDCQKIIRSKFSDILAASGGGPSQSQIQLKERNQQNANRLAELRALMADD